ncbi:hypothetical protein [Deinococcus aerophilus]|uniref:hypothetical protein n=1 Tax=Deinococcus aerophilus TaxID=522488 RepID=UPI0016685DF1|nr:hypothetical protein [Deinococcus aerophilus]
MQTFLAKFGVAGAKERRWRLWENVGVTLAGQIPQKGTAHMQMGPVGVVKRPVPRDFRMIFNAEENALRSGIKQKPKLQQVHSK